MQSPDFKTSKELAVDVISFIEERTSSPLYINGIRTGFKCIDNDTRGLQPGSLTSICSNQFAYRAFSLQLLYNISVNNKVPCGYFSYHLSPKIIGFRLLSLSIHMSHYKLSSGMLKQNELNIIRENGKKIFESPFVISQFYTQSFEELCNDIRRAVATHNLKVILIDNLNSIPLDFEIGSKRDRQQSIAKELKSLALELNISIITFFVIDDSENEKNLEIKSEFLKLYSDTFLLLHHYKDEEEPDELLFEISIKCEDLTYTRKQVLLFDRITLSFSEQY